MSHRSPSLVRTLLGAALLATAAACERATGPASAEATFTGRWADAPWAGSASASLIPGGPAGDTLYVFGTAPPNAGQLPRQALRVRVAPFRGTGTYALHPEGAEFMDLLGGDAATSVYVGRAGEVGGAGTLEVTSYRAADGAIEGTLRMDLEAAAGRAPYGARARFEDGRFRAVVHVYVPPGGGR